MRLIVAAVLACAGLAHAQTVQKAQRSLEDAAQLVRRSPPPCGALQPRFDEALRELRTLDTRDAWDISQSQRQLSELASKAAFARCDDRVVNNVTRAEDALDDVRAGRWRSHKGPRGDDPQRNRFGQLGGLQVQPNSAAPDREKAVKVSVPTLSLHNMRGQRFYLGARFRSVAGNWSEWTTTARWSVPQDPYNWRSPFTHYLRYSTLQDDDFANGRFIVQVAIFDEQGREITSRETPFTVKLPQRPNRPPPGYGPGPGPSGPPGNRPPPHGPGYQQQAMARDCGTGPSDPGCDVPRNGRWAMDAPTWSAMWTALKGQNSDIYRADMLKNLIVNQALTSAQLGLVLDLFNSEIYKLDAAKACAPFVTNPQHAVAHSGKFRSSIYQRDFVSLMSNQR